MAPSVKCLTSAPGLYAIGLYLNEKSTITVGALGTWRFSPGLYIYVGSAWGPGGLAARVGRHLHKTKHPHWHIDYLRAKAQPVALWLAPQAQGECGWAHYMLALPNARVIVPRFGASDCTCRSHLAWLGHTKVETITFPDNATAQRL